MTTEDRTRDRQAGRAAKGLLAVAGVSLLVGCNAGRQMLDETAREVNEKAFNGEVTCNVGFCERDEVARSNSLYDPAKDEIRIAGGWIWEPSVYFTGVVAYEMIHAWQARYRKDGKPAHDAQFFEMRERVARQLDIPVWAIPDGTRPDKLDATREMAYLDARLSSGRSDWGQAGWSTCSVGR